MNKKILLFLLSGILVVGLTGCGTSNNESNKSNNEDKKEEVQKTKEDNQSLVDTLNSTVEEMLEETKSENNKYKVFRPNALYQIFDKLDEKKIKNYIFMASCDKEFKEKVELKQFAYTESMIPNYDGKCTYSTWLCGEEKNNNGTDRYILVLDSNTNDYYSVKVSFKKIEFNNKNRYYPVFSNSSLLK